MDKVRWLFLFILSKDVLAQTSKTSLRRARRIVFFYEGAILAQGLWRGPIQSSQRSARLDLSAEELELHVYIVNLI